MPWYRLRTNVKWSNHSTLYAVPENQASLQCGGIFSVIAVRQNEGAISIHQ